MYSWAVLSFAMISTLVLFLVDYKRKFLFNKVLKLCRCEVLFPVETIHVNGCNQIKLVIVTSSQKL